MIYEQATGLLKSAGGEILAQCYSGVSLGKNNPAYQDVPDVGPIPVGWYTLLQPEYTLPGENSPHGPWVVPLQPDATNEMHGRSGFLMHGDAIHRPGTASRGCVIPLTGKAGGSVVLAGNMLRDAIWKYSATEQHRLQVVSGLPPTPVVPFPQGQAAT